MSKVNRKPIWAGGSLTFGSGGRIFPHTPMSSSPTVRDLARLANCSQTTVSLALRNHPKISPATRKRIQLLAKENGYTRDAALSNLMTRLRASRRNRALEKLALISWWDAPGAWRKDERGKELHAGIRERVAELGYDIEEFWAAQPGLSATRLGRILHARGIRGVILLSKIQPRSRASFNWDLFSAATTNYTIVRPNLHRATHSHFQGAVLALRTLRHRGYRRVGYINTFGSEDRVNDGWLAGYLAHEFRVYQGLAVPPLLMKDWNKAELAEWVERHRPDAVIGNGIEPLKALQSVGVRVPEDLGYASLDCLSDDPSLAGIDQMRREVGRKVVDLVAEQLENNEQGVPARPKTVMIDGVWHDGNSVRTTNPSPARHGKSVAL